MENLEGIKKVLDSELGKPLKDYLLSKALELRNIDFLPIKDTPTHMVIELKAQKRAFDKLREVYEELMSLEDEIKTKDPRDSFAVE